MDHSALLGHLDKKVKINIILRIGIGFSPKTLQACLKTLICTEP